MNKLTSLLLVFALMPHAFSALPPTTLSGQSDTTKKTTFTFKAPKYQATQVSGVESLIETGNKNELKNPGFEGGTTSWTASAGTFTATTTTSEIISGAKSGSWDSSSAGQTLTSDAITVPQGLMGTNVAIGCTFMVPSGTATHTIGVWNGSTLSSTQTITSSSAATTTAVNFVAPGSGTIAIRITSVAADEPELEIDDCYLGTAWGYNLGTISQFGQWTTYTPIFTGFGTVSPHSVKYRTTPQGVQIQGKFTMGTPTGTEARMTLPSICTASSDYTGVEAAGIGFSSAGGVTANPLVEASVGYLTWGRAEAAVAGLTKKNGDTWSGSTAISFEASVRCQGFSSNTVLYTQNGNYGWTAYTPTFTGFGTVASSNCYHKREGEDLHLSCRFTAGTPTATEARVSLPGSLTASSSYGTLELVGYGTSDSANVPTVLMETSAAYLTFGRVVTGSNSGLTKVNGSTIVSAGNGLSFFAQVRIQGWTSNQNAPVLVGSVTSGTAGSVKIESARVYCGNSGSTVYANSGTGSHWLSMTNGGATGRCTVNFTAGTFSAEPICQCSLIDGTSVSASHCFQTATATTSSVAMTRIRAGADSNGDMVITCSGAK